MLERWSLLAVACCLRFQAAIGSNNCSLTPPSARANDCDGGGCQCWCTPAEGAYTIWQWAPSGPAGTAGAPDSCCYDPASDPPCFGARPLLSNTLGDHMVLQSAPRSAQIFGWAPTPGDEITVTVRAANGADGQPPQTHTAVAANDSSWSVSLAPVAAGARPYNISTWSKHLSDGVTLIDVLFGELWMCGGQVRKEILLCFERFFLGEKTDVSRQPRNKHKRKLKMKGPYVSPATGPTPPSG